MPDPASTPETRVGWEWRFRDGELEFADWIPGDPPFIGNTEEEYRASVAGGPARTPGEWRQRMREAFERMASTEADDEAVWRNTVAKFEEADAALADLLGDG